MEQTHGGLVQIIFLSKWVMDVGSILIFQGVKETWQGTPNTPPKFNMEPENDGL